MAAVAVPAAAAQVDLAARGARLLLDLVLLVLVLAREAQLLLDLLDKPDQVRVDEVQDLADRLDRARAPEVRVLLERVREAGLQLLRPSCSAAMARTTPCPAPAPTYEPVPRSK